jgi:1,4-alpha-glucan branching enzyme
MSKALSLVITNTTLVLVLALAAAPGCFGGSGRNAVRGGPEIAEGGVIFRYYDPEASRVCVAGDFNGWSPRANEMVDKNADGQWTLFCNLPTGVYAYKFVVDGDRWIPDPMNPDRVPDGFESENSIVRVPPR